MPLYYLYLKDRHAIETTDWETKLTAMILFMNLNAIVVSG